MYTYKMSAPIDSRRAIEFAIAPLSVVDDQNRNANLAKSLDLSKSIDVDGIISKLKLVKSPAEIAYMEQAGKIVDRAMRIARLSVAPGARECDVAAAVMHASCTGTSEFPGHASRIYPTMPTGRPATAPHLKWTDASYAMIVRPFLN
ncbi:hypothetical protein [Bradyrhizobium sp. 142]|uniref:hypothetical protein n=1 Tax=Bradyrhizobium sp. 142 TaxID=2782618 RepID=UPI001FFA84CC|nr:hypothetical protein [Bradyrhizobium sp. 142]